MKRRYTDEEVDLAAWILCIAASEGGGNSISDAARSIGVASSYADWNAGGVLGLVDDVYRMALRHYVLGETVRYPVAYSDVCLAAAEYIYAGGLP